VAKPSRQGLGITHIKEGLAYELGADVRLEFPVTGLRCEIVIPFASLTEELESSAVRLPSHPDLGSRPAQTHDQPTSLRGIKAIIVEDTFAVAQSLRFLLESLECEVTGIAARSDTAMKLIAEVPFDVAILDIQLSDGNIASVATRIREQGGRIIYVTGYADLESLPLELRAFPRLVKPVDSDLLISTILELLGRVPDEGSE